MSPPEPACIARSLADAAESMAEASSIDELKDQYLKLVPRLLPVRTFGIYLFDGSPDAGLSSATEGVSDVFLARYETYGRTVDPVLRGAFQTRWAVHSSHLMDQGKWTGLPFYREVLSLHGMRMVLEAPLVAGTTVIGTINFADRNPDSLANAADIELASSLGRIVGLAASNVLARQGLRRERDHLAAALDLTRDALILTDRKTGRRHLNSAARQLLEPLTSEDPSEWLEDLMASGHSGPHGHRGASDERMSSWEVALGPAGPRISLRSIPVDADASIAVSVLRIEQPSGQEVTLPPTVKAMLSPREQEVAQLAVAGLQDEQIAAALFLSKYTVKQHLKNIYRKIGVTSRTALIRLVLESH